MIFKQALFHSKLHILQASFYQPGAIHSDKGINIAVDKPVLLMAKYDTDQTELTLSNPEKAAMDVIVAIDGQYSCSTCKITGTGTSFKAMLPGFDEAGKSVTLKLIKL